MRHTVAALALTAFAALTVARPAIRLAGADARRAGGVLQDEEGRKLYLKNCRQCHGAAGEPSSETKHKYPKIKALNDATFLSTISDDSALAVMKHGVGKSMKSFSDKLTPDEMNAVLKYVRTLPEKKSAAR